MHSFIPKDSLLKQAHKKYAFSRSMSSDMELQQQWWHVDLWHEEAVHGDLPGWESAFSWWELSSLSFWVFLLSVLRLTIFVFSVLSVRFFPVKWLQSIRAVTVVVIAPHLTLAYRFKFLTTPVEYGRKVICIKMYTMIRIRWV